MAEQWEIDEYVQLLKSAIDNDPRKLTEDQKRAEKIQVLAGGARYLAEKDRKRQALPPARPAPPAPSPRPDVTQRRQEAAEEYERARRAHLRREQLEAMEADPLLAKVDREIAGMNSDRNYEVVKRLQAAGLRVPYVLALSVKNDAAFSLWGGDDPNIVSWRENQARR